MLSDLIWDLKDRGLIYVTSLLLEGQDSLTFLCLISVCSSPAYPIIHDTRGEAKKGVAE
jgi:hypothetical protein